MMSVIQEWYTSSEKTTKIQELIMRVTNYAWERMTLFEQGTLREEAAQEFTEKTVEILKLREETEALKKLLYESKHINTLANSDGGSAWGMVKDDLDERIDEALAGFAPNAD